MEELTLYMSDASPLLNKTANTRFEIEPVTVQRTYLFTVPETVALSAVRPVIFVNVIRSDQLLPFVESSTFTVAVPEEIENACTYACAPEEDQAD